MWVGVALIGLFAAVIASCAQQANRDALAKRAAEAAACRESLPCWAEKAIIAAGAYCRDPIERLALRDVKWSSSSSQDRFSYYRWLDRERGTVTYGGDDAKFQNGFGAYSPVVYECDFDPAANRALGARIVREGRLPAR